MGLINIVRGITTHPGNAGQITAAVRRFLRWQASSLLAFGPIAVPLVDDTLLLVEKGMTGATGNIYSGLAEWEAMSFALHFLRETELFVDVGANIGAFTVMVGGAVRARVLAVEPVPSTFVYLRRNVAINFLQDRIELHNVGLGDRNGMIGFLATMDTMNRVALDGEDGIEVPLRTLDDLLRSREPILLKIDVEGYELSVLKGAGGVLSSPKLQAIIAETNGQESRYGDTVGSVEAHLRARGFVPISYNPRQRVIGDYKHRGEGNTIFVRDRDAVQQRVSAARTFRTLAGTI